jgi:hypothetical protein
MTGGRRANELVADGGEDQSKDDEHETGEDRPGHDPDEIVPDEPMSYAVDYLPEYDADPDLRPDAADPDPAVGYEEASDRPQGPPCRDCEEPMEAKSFGWAPDSGETVDWAVCEECGLGWGPVTDWVDLYEEEPDVEPDGGRTVVRDDLREITPVVLEFELVRDEYPDRWDRADVAELDVDRVRPGLFHVELADGDAHEIVLQRRGEQILGHCDCEGFDFHTTAGEGPCAHLCALGKLTVLDDIRVPEVEAEAPTRQPTGPNYNCPQCGGHFATVNGNAWECSLCEEHVREVARPPEDLEKASGTDDGAAGAEQDTRSGAKAVPDRAPSEIETAEEFVEEVAGVPKAFVIQMGRGDSKKPYITKEGLNYIAHRQGLFTRAEALSPSWEEPLDMAAWRGIVRDQDGREWVDVGTAWAHHEDMQGAESNLDELASTRATNRALRLATGAGLASIEELDGSDVVRNADGPAPSGTDVPREELTTDGGQPASVTCPRGRVPE